jgi:hypothetical protein
MSVGKRVTEAFDKMLANDPEAALFQICAAVEHTAKGEGRPGGKTSYKSFLTDNIPIICAIGIGPALAGLGVPYTHPTLPATPDGSSRIEDIIYHVVRCGLYHEASLPGDIRFTKKVIGAAQDGTLNLPEMLVTGLIVAVVASPVNVNEHTSDDY